MNTMDKELKNWLSYPRWKTMHDKIVDLVLSKGNLSEGVWSLRKRLLHSLCEQYFICSSERGYG